MELSSISIIGDVFGYIAITIFLIVCFFELLDIMVVNGGKRLRERARKTPYVHLPGYMERYWLVPYRKRTRYAETDGTGWVCWYKRPIAFILQCLGIAVRIHYIKRSDAGKSFHNHPWPYITAIIEGGYNEETPTYDKNGFYLGKRSIHYGPGKVLFRRSSHFHRLEVPSYSPFSMGTDGAWTIFITFWKVNEWGFLIRPKHVLPAHEYKAEWDNGQFPEIMKRDDDVLEMPYGWGSIESGRRHSDPLPEEPVVGYADGTPGFTDTPIGQLVRASTPGVLQVTEDYSLIEEVAADDTTYALKA